METTTWTPAVGDTYTQTDRRNWTVNGQTGEHVIVSRIVVTEVLPTTFKWERTAVISDTDAPSIDQPWPGPQRGETATWATQSLVGRLISDITKAG
jgi:hypothetical protein